MHGARDSRACSGRRRPPSRNRPKGREPCLFQSVSDEPQSRRLGAVDDRVLPGQPAVYCAQLIRMRYLARSRTVRTRMPMAGLISQPESAQPDHPNRLNTRPKHGPANSGRPIYNTRPTTAALRT